MSKHYLALTEDVVEKDQGVAEAGKFLTVGADGTVTTGSVQTITYDAQNKELVIA